MNAPAGGNYTVQGEFMPGSHFDAELTARQGAIHFESRMEQGMPVLVEDVSRPERVRKFVEYGGDPNTVPPASFDYPSEDRTLLHWAALLKRRETAEVLVEAGASLDARDASGRTPLELAVAAGAAASCPAIVELLTHGMPPRARLAASEDFGGVASHAGEGVEGEGESEAGGVLPRPNSS